MNYFLWSIFLLTFFSLTKFLCIVPLYTFHIFFFFYYFFKRIWHKKGNKTFQQFFFLLFYIFYDTLCKQHIDGMWSFYSNWKFFSLIFLSLFSLHFSHTFFHSRDCDGRIFASNRSELPRLTERKYCCSNGWVRNSPHKICNVITQCVTSTAASLSQRGESSSTSLCWACAQKTRERESTWWCW